MIVQDILSLLPEAEKIVAEYGLHCFHCSASALETLEEGCRSHGFEQEEIDGLVDDLNRMLMEKPAKPQTLTITPAAARALKKILTQEKKTRHGLSVTADGHGGFCMDMKARPSKGDRTFVCPEEKGVRFFASALTLARIGGATIDFREERFKLDLAQEEEKTCACTGSCACARSGKG